MIYKTSFWNSSMRKPFSIKWIHLIERRCFDQKYKFSIKNDIVCAWRNFQKSSCGIFTYDKWNSKPQISAIFHFDRVSDGRMAHLLGFKELGIGPNSNLGNSLVNYPRHSRSFLFKVHLFLKTAPKVALILYASNFVESK